MTIDYEKFLAESPNTSTKKSRTALSVTAQRLYDIITDTSAQYDNGLMLIGDYDADGLFSTLILKSVVSFLSGTSPSVRFSARSDGYTLPYSRFRLYEETSDHIVFLDTGSSFDYLVDGLTGVTVIDHHPTDRQTVPEYIYNPNLHGGNSTSCGKVTYHLAEEINEISGGLLDEIMPLLKIYASITVISDMAKLHKENRDFVIDGLYMLNEVSKLEGAPYFTQLLVRNEVIDQQTLSFNLINKVNSYSRMNQDLAEIAPLFSVRFEGHENDMYNELAPDTFRSLWTHFEAVHKSRKDIYKKHEADLLLLLDDPAALQAQKNLIVHVSENDHSGMNGLLAQSVYSMNGTNAVVISWDSARQLYVGSGRGDQVKACLTRLSKNADFHFGGHAQAAGVHLTKEALPEFLSAVLTLNKRRNPSLHKNTGNRRVAIECSLSEFKHTCAEYSVFADGALLDTAFYAKIHDYRLLGSEKQKSGYTLSVVAESSDNDVFIALMHKGELPAPLILEITPFVGDSIFIDRVSENSLEFLERRELGQREQRKICEISF